MWLDENPDLDPDEYERVVKMMSRLIVRKEEWGDWTGRKMGVLHMEGGGTISFFSTPEHQNLRSFNDRAMSSELEE